MPISRQLGDNYISPAVVDLLQTALAPVVLDKSSDRFDVGVEFQKAEIRNLINTIVNRKVL
jgi:hypothetical protein